MTANVGYQHTMGMKTDSQARQHGAAGGDDDTYLDNKELGDKNTFDAERHQVTQIPFKYRVTALVFIIFTSGTEFAEATLGPLKHTLVAELQVTSEVPSAS